MSHGMAASAGSQACFHGFSANPGNPLSPKPILQPFSHLSFNTHLSKQGFSLKTHARSRRFGPGKAVTTDSLHVNTESTLYDLLGISENGTVSDIKQAYRQLARKYHPDVSPPARAEEYTKKFIQVQEAYETLSDPYSRALYDRDMARSLHLAFSVRKPLRYKEGSNERSEWRWRWQSQITELQMRSANQDLRKEETWAARMRRQCQGGSKQRTHPAQWYEHDTASHPLNWRKEIGVDEVLNLKSL